jgi:hypothetical protein
MKDLTPAFAAHLKQGVTTLCTCLEIRRRDGKSFSFTDHDMVVTMANVAYVPYSSFARTAISTSLDLEVDQMEVKGILNSKHVARDDVASGAFDFAEVRVSVVNYEAPDSGAAVLRVGWLGEVTMNEDGTFNAELRGLSQVFTYRIGESYSPECRADLGDRRCKIAIAPPRWAPNTPYTTGDVVRGVIAAANGFRNLSFTNGGFDQDAATLPTLVRDIPGWTTYGDARGRWTVKQDPFFGTPGHDSYAAFGTDDGDVNLDSHFQPQHTVADIGMYQDIDLDAQGVDHYAIDTGLCRLYSTVWMACVNGSEAGVRYRIFALDEGGTQIGSAALYDTGLQKTAEDRWFQTIVKDILLPAGTRKLRFDLFAHKRPRFSEGAAFDSVTAAVNFPGGTLGSADQFGDVAFQAQNPGATGATEPAWGNLLGSTYTDGSITWKAIKAFKTTSFVDHTEHNGRTIVPLYVFDADGYYDGGLITWETGLNAGRTQEIKSWAAGKLNLFERPFNLPQPDDRFVISPGCDKTRATCVSKFSNILNFRGEPDVPGQDKYYTGPNAPAQ